MAAQERELRPALAEQAPGDEHRLAASGHPAGSRDLRGGLVGAVSQDPKGLEDRLGQLDQHPSSTVRDVGLPRTWVRRPTKSAEPGPRFCRGARADRRPELRRRGSRLGAWRQRAHHVERECGGTGTEPPGRDRDHADELTECRRLRGIGCWRPRLSSRAGDAGRSQPAASNARSETFRISRSRTHLQPSASASLLGHHASLTRVGRCRRPESYSFVFHVEGRSWAERHLGMAWRS